MSIVKSEFVLALNQVAGERGISTDEVITSIEQALVAAYKKEYGLLETKEIYTATLNRSTGEVQVFKDGENITPPGFGRIAAQTAKQVILQKIREAEKKTIISHYKNQIGTAVRGRIIRYDGYNAYVDIGKTESLLSKEEQIKSENYSVNTSLIVYIKDIVQDKFGSPRILVSRADQRLVEELFKREVPEIANNTVVIKKTVREPGERSKIAVFSDQSGVDPVGACIGQKGVRVQTVTEEFGNKEKMDIVPWNSDPKIYLTSALSPAKIHSIELDNTTHVAKVTVEESQAPLAIGRNGINVNLASRLTGYQIDIVQIPNTSETKQETASPSEEKKAA